MSRTKYNTKKTDEENIKLLRSASVQTSNFLKEIEKVNFSKVSLTGQEPNFEQLSVLAEIYNNLDVSFNKSLAQCRSLSLELIENYKKLEEDLGLPENSPNKLTSVQLSRAMLAVVAKQKILKTRFAKHLEHKEQLAITKDFFEDMTKLPGNIDYGYNEFQKVIKQIQSNYEYKVYEEHKHKKFSEELFKARKDNAYNYLGQSKNKLGFLEKLKRWLGLAKSKRVKARKSLKIVRDKQYIPQASPEILVDKGLADFKKLQTNLESFTAKTKVATTIQSAFRKRLAKKKLDNIRADFDETSGSLKKAKQAQVTKLKRLIYEEYMTRYFVGMALTHSPKLTLQQNRMATALGLIGSAADKAGAMGAGSMLTSVVADIMLNNRQQQAKDFAAFVESNRQSLTAEEMAKEVANIAAYRLQNSLNDANIAELAKEFSHRASNNVYEIKKECKDLADLTPNNFAKQYAEILFNLSASSGDKNIEHTRNIQRLNEYKILKNPRPLTNNYKTQIDLGEIKKIQVTPEKYKLNIDAILFEIYKQSRGQLSIDAGLAMQGAQAITTAATQTIGLEDKNLSKAMKPLLKEILFRRLEEEGFLPDLYSEDQLKSFISKADLESMLAILSEAKKTSFPIDLNQAIAKSNQPLLEDNINITALLNNIQDQSRNALQFSSMQTSLEKLVKKKLEEYQYPLDSSNPDEWKKYVARDDIETMLFKQTNSNKYKGGNISVTDAIAVGRQQITESGLDVEAILDALKDQSAQALKRKPMRNALEELVCKKLKKAGVDVDKSTPEEWQRFTTKEDIEQMLINLKQANKYSLSVDNAIETSMYPAEAVRINANKQGAISQVKKLLPTFKAAGAELNDSSSVSSDGHTNTASNSSNESMVEKITRSKTSFIGKLVK